MINSFIFYLFIGERVSFLDHLRLEFLADYAPEYVVLFNAEETYLYLTKLLENKVNLQIAHPNTKEYDIEQSLFENHMDSEYYIESLQKVPDSFEEFKKQVKEKTFEEIEYRTDKVGFPYLRTLAHKYFKNELFPDEWRKKIPKE